MHTLLIALRYTLIVMVVLLLGSLAGWYFYTRSQENPLAPEKKEGADVPTGFQGNRGLPETVIGGDLEDASSTTPIQSGGSERLWRVDQGPVAGFGFVTVSGRATTSPAALYFVERANGYVFRGDPDIQTVERITNTLMAKTYEAYFAASGTYVYLRSIDESGNLTTYAGRLDTSASTTPYALTGSMMQANIRKLAVDNVNRRLFLLTNDPSTSGSIGTTQPFDGMGSKKIFSSFIRNWRPIIAQNQLVVFTEPADNLLGYAYKVGESGALTLLVGPIPGLSIASHPTEDAFLYSGSTGGQIGLFVRVGKKDPVELSIQTIADKCAWAPGKILIAYCAVPAKISSASFMNEWYQGSLHTADAWWRIDAAAGTAELLYTPQGALDAHDPAIDPLGKYIAFTSGTNQSLWLLRIVQ